MKYERLNEMFKRNKKQLKNEELKYGDAKKLVFASGKMVDGYDGDFADVEFAFDPKSKKILVVGKSGFHTFAPVPTEKDAKSALWVLQNNPKAKKYVKNIKSLIGESSSIKKQLKVEGTRSMDDKELYKALDEMLVDAYTLSLEAMRAVGGGGVPLGKAIQLTFRKYQEAIENAREAIKQ